MPTPPSTPITDIQNQKQNVASTCKVTVDTYDDCFNTIVDGCADANLVEATNPPPNSPEGPTIIQLSPKDYARFLQNAKNVRKKMYLSTASWANPILPLAYNISS
jgi:hypothetical protein